jgi:hypothetical protein
MQKKRAGQRARGNDASRADKYDLYQRSVQVPEHEVAIFSRFYRDAYGSGKPRVLREDFCGTAAVCHAWVKGRPDRAAYGVDLDPEPLGWAREHNTPKLSARAQAQVKLVQGDVRTARTPKADIVSAQNFSFYVFATRASLLEYFRAARSNLSKRGIMVLDMIGGPEVMVDESEESRVVGGRFTYVWEQCRYDPIRNYAVFRIHFRFRDESEMHNAFEYRWRMWTIPEVRETLLDAGFARADVYWEGTNKRGKGNSVYRKTERGTADAAWVAYIIGVK